MSDIMLDYYPHKDACPQDSKPCLNDKCKYWVKDKVCWDIEFGSIVENMFKCDRHDYIRFEVSSELWLRFWFRPELWVEEKTNFNKPPRLVLSIGLNSQRLAKNFKKYFNLVDWKIESRCYDGGDDHDLVFTTTAPYQEKDKVIKLLEDIKELISKMIASEKDINTCALCKRHCESLNEHGAHSICYGCEQRIISENIVKYFQI